MINTDDFIKRIEIILDYYSLNASTFADKIGVQRSSLSHLLSGRNKPSLDFILKILDVFPEVDLYWLLNGKGVFPEIPNSEKIKKNLTEEIFDSTPTVSITESQDLFSHENPIKSENEKKENQNNLQNSFQNSSSEKIDKIVFFYKNGTFKIFSQND